MRALLTFGNKVEFLSSLVCVVLDLKWELLQQGLESREIFCPEDYLSMKICGRIVERNVAFAELVYVLTAFLPPKKELFDRLSEMKCFYLTN